MKVLFVHPACRVSIWDVGRGYCAALKRLLGDANVKDYFLDRRLAYHLQATEGLEKLGTAPKGLHEDQALMSRFASETALNEALYFGADLVVIASGLNFHPIALWQFERVGIPAAVILTENPYDDEPQKEWCANYQSMAVFTHERYSAHKWGWSYLPHAYDPTVHKPVDADPEKACDVFMVGTGWRERQMFLEAVDWTGINLRIHGPRDAWPALHEQSAIWPYFHAGPIDNSKVASWYASAKINLNFHRRHPLAWSPNPRAIEIAACGAFQLSDPRPGVSALFGDSVPIFESPERLGALIRQYLGDEASRRALADESRRRIVNETFDARARQLVDEVVDRFKLPWLQAQEA